VTYYRINRSEGGVHTVERFGIKIKVLLVLLIVMTASMFVITWFNLHKERKGMQSIAGNVLTLGEEIQARQKDKLSEVEEALVKADTRALRTKGETLAGLVAGLAPTPLVTFDTNKLDEYCGSVCEDPDVVFCYIAGQDGGIRSTFANSGDETLKALVGEEAAGFEQVSQALEKSPEAFRVTTPIGQGEQKLGTVTVYVRDSATQRASGRFDAFHQKTGELFDGLIADINAEVERRARSSLVLGLIVSVSMVLAGILVLYFLIGSLVERPIARIIEGLNVGCEQVVSTSSQLSASSQQLSEGASEQAASLEETSSSLEQMASMTRQNATNAGEAQSIVNRSVQDIREASEAMAGLTVSIQEISRASEETQKIIKTIDEIAFQTNLLALNAAVEAARAGEAGAGFAVVADEVRNLALRAAEAARNTAALIEGTSHKVEEGAGQVRRANEVFDKVSEVSGKVSEIVGEIATASEEQAQGIELVSKAVSRMDRVVQRNASNAEETASASEEMHGQAESMRNFVHELVGVVGRVGTGEEGNGRAGRPRKSLPAGGRRSSSGSVPGAASPEDREIESRVPQEEDRELDEWR
jgi:methyl-accepting chemotaxis protein